MTGMAAISLHVELVVEFIFTKYLSIYFHEWLSIHEICENFPPQKTHYTVSQIVTFTHIYSTDFITKPHNYLLYLYS